MIRSFRYPLLLASNQENILFSWLDALRQLYNAALEERISAYQKAKKNISRFNQHKSLTIIRQEDEFWKNIPATVGRSALDRLDKAYSGFFRRLKKRRKTRFS